MSNDNELQGTIVPVSEKQTTGAVVSVIITLIVFCAIYTPLSMYQIWRLYHCTYRSVKPIEILLKRQTSLSLVCCIAYSLQFIDLSLWSMAYTNWFTPTTKESIIFTSQFIHLLMQFVLSFFIVLRFWLLHFSIKYEMISANDHWKKIIDPDYVQKNTRTSALRHWKDGPYHEYISHTEWIIKNKNKWGNLKFCLKTGGVLFIILFLAICVSQTLHTFYDANAFELIRAISSMITYGIFLLIWSLMLAIYCRTPSFYDHIYVKKELSYLFHLMVGFFFVYIIFAVLFGFGNDNVYTASYAGRVLLLFHCVALGNFIAILVFTYLPLSKLQSFRNIHKRSHSMLVDMNKLHRKQITLEDVLKDEYGFSALIKHLAKEFSTEVLLSIVEFTMFKKYLYDNVLGMVGFYEREKAMFLEDQSITVASGFSTSTGKRRKKSDIDYDAPYLALPFEKIPKSAIVYNEEIGNTEKCYLLYIKYIRPGSEYEINISGALRTRFRDLMDNKERWVKETSRTMEIGEMANIFDKCNDVNLGLLKHSFTRFKNGDEWNEVVKTITTKQSLDIDVNKYGK